MRQLYDAMLSQVKQATLAAAIPSSNLRVLDAAVPQNDPHRQDRFSLERLRSDVTRILGIILNDWNPSSAGYRHHTGYCRPYTAQV